MMLIPSEVIASDAIFQYLGRHLIGLAFGTANKTIEASRPLGEQATACFCSGFVWELKDEWYWITAGHVIEEIDGALQRQQVFGFRLIDSFGIEPKHCTPFPFDYRSAWKWYEYHSGLDYGAVRLGLLERETFKTNGFIPFRCEDMEPLTAQTLLLFDLSETDVKRNLLFSEPHLTIYGRPDPSVVMLESISISPKTPDCYEQYVAQIAGTWQETDTVVGMSGGPVFVVDLDGGKYMPIGLQSSWNPAKLTTTICPIGVILPRLLNRICDRDLDLITDDPSIS